MYVTQLHEQGRPKRKLGVANLFIAFSNVRVYLYYV
jgi:hypothetical protein